ncbi:MAG: hypothetical protein BroJett020_11730 [Bacteroidota bacterium]|nr:transposase [Flavobacteriales bacterium]GIK69878.1 MAG: hypothetical protein BroJett020_11730 [Bacteroidota bacterium]
MSKINEVFNRIFRNNVLYAYLFENIDQVGEITSEWIDDYNNVRPHKSLKGKSPCMIK